MSDGHSEAAKIGREEDEKPETGQGEMGPRTLEIPAQVAYGVSVFEMDNGLPIVHITGEPDMGQIQRLLAGALANLQADITARKVALMLDAREQQTRIVRPGQ